MQRIYPWHFDVSQIEQIIFLFLLDHLIAEPLLNFFALLLGQQLVICCWFDFFHEVMLLTLHPVPFCTFLFSVLPRHIFQLGFSEAQIILFDVFWFSFGCCWAIINGQSHLAVIKRACQFVWFSLGPIFSWGLLLLRCFLNKLQARFAIFSSKEILVFLFFLDLISEHRNLGYQKIYWRLGRSALVRDQLICSVDSRSEVVSPIFSFQAKTINQWISGCH